MCNTISSVSLTDAEAVGLEKFAQGELLQVALPDTSAPVRKFLHTGYCKECQQMLFSNTDDRIKAV